MVRRGRSLHAVESILFSIRHNGWMSTMERIWHRGFGREEWLGFVRYLEPLGAPLPLPREVNGFTIRQLQPENLDAAAALFPPSVWRLPHERRCERLREWIDSTLVAERENRVVGIVHYLDCTDSPEPWRAAMEPWLRFPVRVTKFLYVAPGERGAAWALARCGNDWCASRGVSTIVAWVESTNQPSILVTRFLGGKLVCRMIRRYWLGKEKVACYPVTEREYPALGSVGLGRAA